MCGDFDVLEYISSLTGFSFDKSVIKRIAIERQVLYAKSIADIDKKQRDLITADLLLVAYLSPTSTSSITNKHGDYTKTIGSQTINSKKDIYNMLYSLYKRWNDDKLEAVKEMEGGLQWLDY